MLYGFIVIHWMPLGTDDMHLVQSDIIVFKQPARPDPAFKQPARPDPALCIFRNSQNLGRADAVRIIFCLLVLAPGGSAILLKVPGINKAWLYL